MQIKKETWILLALLGFGLYRHVMAKKQEEKQSSQSQPLNLDKVFRIAHDKNPSNPNQVVESVYAEIGEQNGLTKEWVMNNYEIFRQRLQADPNTGL